MRCYICDRETNDWHQEPDGKWVSLCDKCRAKSARYSYKNVNEEECDMALLRMKPEDLIKAIDNDCRTTDCKTTTVSK